MSVVVGNSLSSISALTDRGQDPGSQAREITRLLEQNVKRVLSERRPVGARLGFEFYVLRQALNDFAELEG
jgi:hypothetical protein